MKSSKENTKDTINLTFALSNIRSAWNVGAIMRTCDALEAGLILVGYTPRPTEKNLKLIKKTAIGAEETVKWQSFEHYQEVFENFNSHNNNTHWAIEISETSKDIFEFIKNKPPERPKNLILWLGNEIRGLEKDLTKQCQQELHFPMYGSKESLNVASTAAVAGYIIKGFVV